MGRHLTQRITIKSSRAVTSWTESHWPEPNCCNGLGNDSPLKLFREIDFRSESGVCLSLDVLLEEGVFDCDGGACPDIRLQVPLVENNGGKNRGLAWGETSSNILDIPKGRVVEWRLPIIAPLLMLFQINSCDFSALSNICKRPGGAAGRLSKNGPPVLPIVLGMGPKWHVSPLFANIPDNSSVLSVLLLFGIRGGILLIILWWWLCCWWGADGCGCELCRSNAVMALLNGDAFSAIGLCNTFSSLWSLYLGFRGPLSCWTAIRHTIKTIDTQLKNY